MSEQWTTERAAADPAGALAWCASQEDKCDLRLIAIEVAALRALVREFTRVLSALDVSISTSHDAAGIHTPPRNGWNPEYPIDMSVPISDAWAVRDVLAKVPADLKE